MALENIGFYTLSDNRVKQVSEVSPMWRTELILTDKCNFNCGYCRHNEHGELTLQQAVSTILHWSETGLKNIRFSGGEPTLYKDLPLLVQMSNMLGCEHIAISTNGSAKLSLYKRLIELGVNDFSISLDACCASNGDMMAGRTGVWETIVSNIEELSKLTYVTVGVVLTDTNSSEVNDIIEFADAKGVSDIRVISAAQYNINPTINVSADILERHPILDYRYNNLNSGRSVRGLTESDNHRCPLIIDDSAVSGIYHYPCIIYMREGGNPIGEVGSNMRADRIKWARQHDTHEDPICKGNCLDVCIDYNNKYTRIRSSD